MAIFVLQMSPVVAAVSVVIVTAVYFLLQGEKKKKLLITLQDPMVKYPLRLVDKQVECTQEQAMHSHSDLTMQFSWDVGTLKMGRHDRQCGLQSG